MNLMIDTQGALYATAERRYHLFKLCDRLQKDRRIIRWSKDLHCYVLIVSDAKDKARLRQWSKEERAACWWARRS